MTHGVSWVKMDVWGIFSFEIDVSLCFLGHIWCLRVFCLVIIDVACCFLAQNWCLRVFAWSKWMSQGVFRVKSYVSGCDPAHDWCLSVKIDVSGSFFAIQNECVRVLSLWQSMSQGVFWLKIDVPGCFLDHNWCLSVFSASVMMSQGLFWFKIDVSGCPAGQNSCLTGVGC